MGVCMSKAKEFTKTIDKHYIEMSVKNRKVSIAERALTLSNDYTNRISAGERVIVKPEEFLPRTDLTGIDQELTEVTPAPQRLKTALYVATNQIFRNQLKQEIWTEMKAGMEARKLPAAVISHSQIASDQAVEFALTKQVDSMAHAVSEGRPMVTEEEKREVAQFRAAQAPEVVAPGIAAPVGPADTKTTPNMHVGTEDKLNTGVGGGGLVEKEKEPYAAEAPRDTLQGGQYERNTEIAAV